MRPIHLYKSHAHVGRFRLIALGVLLTSCASTDTGWSQNKLLTELQDVCSTPDHTFLEDKGLECVDVKLDFSEFELETPHGLEAAERKIRQVSHAACRMRTRNPSRKHKQIYAQCRAMITGSVLQNYLFSSRPSSNSPAGEPS